MEICVAFVAVTVRTAEPSDEIEVGLALKVTRTTGLPDMPEPHPLNTNSRNEKTIHFAFTKARQLRTAPHDPSTVFLLSHLGVECAANIRDTTKNPKALPIQTSFAILVMHTPKEPVLDSRSSLSKVRLQAALDFDRAHRDAPQPALPWPYIHR